MGNYKSNYAQPINLDSMFGEINVIGNNLERWSLDYRHMHTDVLVLANRLQELYKIYQKMKIDEKVS